MRHPVTLLRERLVHTRSPRTRNDRERLRIAGRVTRHNERIRARRRDRRRPRNAEHADDGNDNRGTHHVHTTMQP
jgi:hypothetical protein